MTDNWDNVILLSADALRADHLSCYGYDRKTSPELDRLASESFRFTNAYSASSHTREAVPALLTGNTPTSLSIRAITSLPRPLLQRSQKKDLRLQDFTQTLRLACVRLRPGIRRLR